MFNKFSFALISFTLISCAQTKKATNLEKPASNTKTAIVAHRGAWKNTGHPQNSVAAFKAAIDLKCYGSEMDVHMTSDGYIVVNHDPTYHGVDVQNATLAELRKNKLSNGEELPLLSQFLEVLRTQNHTKLIVEIKPSQRGKEWALKTADAVVKEIKKYKASSQIEYISFDFEICRQVKKIAPDATVQYLNGDKDPDQIKNAGVSGIDYHFSVFQKNPQYLTRSHELGLVTNAWTVNDPAIMDWLIAHEIGFITTDEPELLADRLRQAPVTKGYKLVWSDEFLYSGLPDINKWAFEEGGNGWGNNELQYYTRSDTSNAVVSNGVLKITALKEHKENSKYTSARLVTQGKAAWRYGRIEARAKLPNGVGVWPAFWMLGNNINTVGWPDCGEIDIMEYVGYKPEEIIGTIHTKAFNHIVGTQKGGQTTRRRLTDEFNVYAIEWDAGSIRFFLNETPYYEFKKPTNATASEWPFDQSFFVILNLAIGGNLGGKEGVDDSIFPATYTIDYVRVYQKQ